MRNPRARFRSRSRSIHRNSVAVFGLCSAALLTAACSSTPGAPQPVDAATVTADCCPLPDSAAPLADAGPSPDHGPQAASCTQPKCPACVAGKTGCAAKGPFIAGTCCARGDNIVALATGTGAEVVDLETDGTYVVLCGGFGARISDVSKPADPVFLGSATQRCQRAAFGATPTGGGRVLYLAHHGDSWVTTPFLATYQISPSGKLIPVDQINDGSVLFEGLLYHGGLLYVAAHEGGIRIYQPAADGKPAFKAVVNDGIKNAWKLAAHKDRLYVADQTAGLHVFSLATPLSPKRLHTVTTSGSPRDVATDGSRIYVAQGGGGIDVYDAVAGGAPKLKETIAGEGSVQAVDVEGGVLAVAGWNHAAIYDASSLALLGTERTRKGFEQDVGIALHKQTIFVGEWEGLHVLRYRPGYIAPDIFIREEIFTLAPGKQHTRAVLVKNLGLLDLHVSKISADNAAFSIKNDSFTVAPGKADVFELAYAPPAQAAPTQATIKLITDDPDDGQGTLSLPVELKQTSKIDVGDAIGEEFGFLDPNQAGQVSGLKGKVVILAYFALF